MDTIPPPASVASDRISALRAAMREVQIDGYLVPHGDEHQGEFNAPYAERLKWLTGFAGSAGFSAA